MPSWFADFSHVDISAPQNKFVNFEEKTCPSAERESAFQTEVGRACNKSEEEEEMMRSAFVFDMVELDALVVG